MHQRGNVALVYIRLHGFERSEVRRHRCVHGFADEGHFASIFVSAQRGQERIHVLKNDDCVRALEKGQGRGIGGGFSVGRDVAVDDRARAGNCLFDFLGKLTHLFHAVEAGDLGSVRILGAELGARVFLAAHIVRREEENLGVRAGRRIAPSIGGGRNQQRCSGLCLARQIIKVILLAKFVDLVRPLNGCEQNDHASLLGQSLAAGVIVSARLPIKRGAGSG